MMKEVCAKITNTILTKKIFINATNISTYHFHFLCAKCLYSIFVHKPSAYFISNQMPLIPLIFARKFEMEKLFHATGAYWLLCCAVVIVRIASNSAKRLRSTISLSANDNPTVRCRGQWKFVHAGSVLCVTAFCKHARFRRTRVHCVLCSIPFRFGSSTSYQVYRGFQNEWCVPLFFCVLVKIAHTQSELTFHQLSRQRKPQD